MKKSFNSNEEFYSFFYQNKDRLMRESKFISRGESILDSENFELFQSEIREFNIRGEKVRLELEFVKDVSIDKSEFKLNRIGFVS